MWDQAGCTTAVRGIEFGVEEILDQAPNVKNCYVGLTTTESYRQIETNMGETTQAILNQAHSIVKGIYNRYESYEHGIDTPHDGVKITIVEIKVSTLLHST
jgi:hypothetical protein